MRIEETMKKTQTTLISLSLGLALILYLFDLTRFVYVAVGRTIQIYPAAFFALLAVWLLIRAFTKKLTSKV